MLRKLFRGRAAKTLGLFIVIFEFLVFVLINRVV